MVRRAFVVVADWPYRQLSDAGKLTWCCSGGSENHVGIFIPCCTPEEIEAHSAPDVSDPTGRGQQHVTFDFMMDKYPRFQSPDNPNYYTKEANTWLYPILDVDAADVHALCLRVARLRPYNHFLYRCNYLFFCWPTQCWCSNVDELGPMTCVAMTMRIIAAAKSGTAEPLTSDAATFRTLRMARLSCHDPCAPLVLTAYTPRAGLEAMQQGGVVGRPIEGFEAAARQCRVAVQQGSALGSGYPLLSLMCRE